MNLDGYSFDLSAEEKDKYALARAESVNASYKDLTQVCGRIRNKPISWALDFLDKAAKGKIPVLYKKFNKNLGHRREIKGRQGRYPKKAAAMVLKLLKSAEANAKIKNLENLVIAHVSANKKYSLPRLLSKGRHSRADYELARIEIILKGKEAIEKKVQIKTKVQDKKEQEHQEIKEKAHETHEHKSVEHPSKEHEHVQSEKQEHKTHEKTSAQHEHKTHEKIADYHEQHEPKNGKHNEKNQEKKPAAQEANKKEVK